MQLKWTEIKNYINDNFIQPIKDKLQGIKDWWAGFKADVIEKWTGIKNYINDNIPEFFSIGYWIGIATDIGSAMGGIGTSMIAGIKSGINGLIGLLNGLFASINFSIDIPEVLGGGSIGMDLSSWNIPLIPLAKGGIVNSPTLAMIGEAGPEAVVPLSGNNAGIGGTYNITVNAGGITDRSDKRQLAREIGNLIQSELSRTIGGTTMRGRY